MVMKASVRLSSVVRNFTKMAKPFVSSRASANLTADPLTTKLHAIRSHCFHNQYDQIRNPKGIVALAIAENKLMRNEIVDHINQNMQITPWHLTYGHGPAGSIDLRKAVADFVTEVFKPSMEIGGSHVAICNGAGSAVDNLSFVLAEPGEGILVGRPLYVGFFPDIEARARSVTYQGSCRRQTDQSE
jgi:aspartate/methionine/tyrosine aminotransferase